MKYAIITGLLLSAIFSQAQHKIDTAKVFRLCVDTVGNIGTTGEWVLEVRELHNEAEGMIDPGFCLNCNYANYWKHLKYLQLNKTPVPKWRIIVNPDIEADQDPTPPPPPIDTLWLKNLPSLPAGSTYFHSYDPLEIDTTVMYTGHAFPKNFTIISDYDTVLENRWVWNKRKYEHEVRERKKVYALYPPNDHTFYFIARQPAAFLDLKRKPLKSRFWVIGEKVKEGER